MRLKNIGFSLLEIMVAGAIIGGLAMAVAEILKNMNYNIERSDAASEQNILVNQINQLLAIPNFCAASLADNNLNPVVDNAVRAISMTNKDPGGPTIIDGTGGNLTIPPTAINTALKGTSNIYSKLDIYRFVIDLGLDNGSGVRSGSLHLFTAQKNKPGDDPNKLVRAQGQSFSINFRVDGTGVITECSVVQDETAIRIAACGAFNAVYDSNYNTAANEKECQFTRGSAGLPGITFGQDLGGPGNILHTPGTGFYQLTDDTIGATSSGTAVMTWGPGTATAVNDLVVGNDADVTNLLNTTNLTVTGQVNNSLLIQNDLTVNENFTAGAANLFRVDSVGQAVFVSDRFSAPLIYSTNAAEFNSVLVHAGQINESTLNVQGVATFDTLVSTTNLAVTGQVNNSLTIQSNLNVGSATDTVNLLVRGNEIVNGTLRVDGEPLGNTVSATFAKDLIAQQNVRIDGTLDITSGVLQIGGGMPAGHVHPAVPSDVRLKRDISKLTNSMEKLKRLQGVSFLFKKKVGMFKGRHLGLIAQEVESVFPEVVRDYDKNGHKMIRYEGLVAPMIEAIKDLERENSKLKEELQVQNRKLESLFILVCQNRSDESICQE